MFTHGQLRGRILKDWKVLVSGVTGHCLLALQVNYDYPEDLEVANNGGRVTNQKLVEDAFATMINVVDCSQFK